MRNFKCILLLGLACCAAPAPKTATYPEAQEIVHQVAARYSSVVRLTLHAVPTGTTQARVIASTVPAKLGAPSDPEDLQAMHTKEAVTLMEGKNLDYTAPVCDGNGRAIAAVGVTLAGNANTSREVELVRAREIAAEVTSAILSSGKSLW